MRSIRAAFPAAMRACPEPAFNHWRRPLLRHQRLPHHNPDASRGGSHRIAEHPPFLPAPGPPDTPGVCLPAGRHRLDAVERAGSSVTPRLDRRPDLYGQLPGTPRLGDRPRLDPLRRGAFLPPLAAGHGPGRLFRFQGGRCHHPRRLPATVGNPVHPPAVLRARRVLDLYASGHHCLRLPSGSVGAQPQLAHAPEPGLFPSRLPGDGVREPAAVALAERPLGQGPLRHLLQRPRRGPGILRMHAHDLDLKPSQTVYTCWRRRPRQRLRFSKSGDPNLEEACSRHFLRAGARATAATALAEAPSEA